MNKRPILITILLISVFVLPMVLAYDPNYPISGGRIRNMCGGTQNDPNCYPNTCSEYTGSCNAVGGYSVSVYRCNRNTLECLDNGIYNLNSASVSQYAEPCKTIQIDVVDSSGVGRDWIVWVSDQWSNCGGGCPYASTQARFHTDAHPTLESYLTVNYGERVKAVAVHNQDTSRVWPNIQLTINGPNNFQKTCLNEDCWFTPPYSGTYSLNANSLDGSGLACKDTATLVVTGAPPTTTTTTTTIPTCPKPDICAMKKLFAIAGPDMTVCANELTLLDGSESYSLNSYIISYEWWDDGSFLSNDDIFLWSFSEGTHVVSLIVRDAEWRTAIDTVVINAESCNDNFQIDVKNVDASPSSLNEGDNLEITGTVTLLQSPAGSHPVEVKLYIDGDLKNTESIFLNQGDSEFVSFVEDTDGFDDGSHTAKIVATVHDAASDQDEDTFSINGDDHEELQLDDFEVSPSSFCQDEDELVELSVDVKLNKGDDEKIQAKFYVEDDDDHFFFVGDNDHKLDKGDEKTFTATYEYEAFDLDIGKHKVKVVVDNDDKEIEFTSFRIKDCGGIKRDFRFDKRVFVDQFSLLRPTHCLSVQDLWADEKLIPGKTVDIRATVSNCGSSVENNINTDLNAFKKTYSIATYSLSPSQSRDVIFTINVPKDAEETENMKATAYNAVASDSMSNSFIISDGIPVIFAKKEYTVNICETSKIKFDVLNKGDVSDVFTLSVSGESADWFSVLPGKVDLKASQRKTIEAVVDVPCDAKSGKYDFSLTASGSPAYTATSTLRAVKPFKFPTIDFNWMWLLWLLLGLLLLALLLALIFCFPFRLKKCCRHKPVGCFGKHGC